MRMLQAAEGFPINLGFTGKGNSSLPKALEEQVRAGAAQTLNGFVTSFPNAGLTDAWRRERIAVLTAAAPRAAKFLLPEQAAELRESTIKVADGMKDPAVKTGLTAFADTLKAK